jgi:hypothetical protein
MNIKSLLFGSAAALVAVSGARAADAVVIAEPEPVEYVRVCDTYGVGFYYIPGTETCLKVSGYFRYDVGIGFFGLEDVLRKKDFAENRFDTDDTYNKRARFQLRVDSRTETELGTLRTYAALNFQWDTAVTGEVTALPDGTLIPFNNGFTYSDAFWSPEHIYVELGGFRAGKTDSLFSTFTGYAGGVIHDDIIPYGPFDTHQIAYTWTGGNGWTAAVALEEGAGSRITPFNLEPGPTIFAGPDLYTLDRYVPNVVAGVGWTGGWGGVSVVGGYDAVWEQGAVKGRIDFNVNDALSVFVMAAWASVDNRFFDEVIIDGVPVTTFSDVHDSPNFYAPWGGKWGIWGGGTWRVNEKASVNVQISYDDLEDFAAVANVAYTLVPNFVITPEVAYIDNFKDFDELPGFDRKKWGFFVRAQANFGG